MSNLVRMSENHRLMVLEVKPFIVSYRNGDTSTDDMCIIS